jgi:predicted  nucleic acid-binding Zn-ribbon protein
MAFEIRNVAGIRRGEATLEPGLNAVRALNWQGKTSFVRAIETAMGTERALTEGATEGGVELRTDDRRARVSLTRTDGVVVRDGDPYLDDEYDRVCAGLYAFLDDDNEVRAAVRRGENLEAVLTRPLDFEDIDSRLANLRNERRTVESELEDAREADRQLSDVERTISRLEADLADLQAERESLLDGEEGGDTREKLGEARAERSRVADRIDRVESAVDRIEAELADLRAERDGIDVPEVDVEGELDSARAELDRVETDIDLLRGLYSANRRIVEEGRFDLVADVDRGLLADSVDCWVCGAATDADTLESRVEALGDRLSALEERAEGYRERIADLEDQRGEAERARRRRRELDREIADLEGTLADRRETLDRLRERREGLRGRIDDLAEGLVDGDRLTEVSSELKYTESRLAEARERREGLAERAGRTEALEATLSEITEEIDRLRRRKERVKQETRETFDSVIADLVERFQTSFETARLTSEFDLVVARDGREVSLDALSEGELELIGIVAALSGYRAYGVGDRVPVLVLDGLGGLAEHNLRTLVEYLADWAEYLVFTAYPEHTTFEGHELDPDDWRVVSDEPPAESTA